MQASRKDAVQASEDSEVYVTLFSTSAAEQRTDEGGMDRGQGRLEGSLQEGDREGGEGGDGRFRGLSGGRWLYLGPLATDAW